MNKKEEAKLKALKWLDENFETYFLIVTLVIMVIIVTMQVFLRTFFKYSFVWAEELTRYIMLYQIWVGAAYAVKEDAHLRITTVRDRSNKKNQIRIELIVIILWTAFSAFLAIKSGQLVNIIFARGQISPAMQIPMGYAYFSVTFGCTLMVIRLLQKLHREVLEIQGQEG